MPYFLVTHTALIEAEDEEAAAASAFENIVQSDRVKFEVRADEQTIKQVTIPTKRVTLPGLAGAGVSVSQPLPPEQKKIIHEGNETAGEICALPRGPRARTPSPGILYCAVAGMIVAGYAILHLFI
jgi:hypothetical protein